jgi:conjugative relaxase-like TrwC/TraI family protein
MVPKERGLAMTLIFPRYDPAGIGEYYADDFTPGRAGSKPVMWVDELGDQVLGSPFQYAEVPAGGVELGRTIMWNAMGKADFDGIIKEVSKQFKPENFTHRPFALGTIFAPPKSVSLAALAGPRVLRVIIDAHRRSVNFVADLLARMLATRKRGEEAPIPAHVLRFTHPFSRANDPQLHDHLEWFPDPREGALHTYPWFFFQHALRQIYHYSLAAELSTRGFRIDVVDPEGLCWELSGIDPKELMIFSKRSEEVETLARAGCRKSLPAALRWAALTSSKASPKFPGLALGTARGGWDADCPQERCSVLRGGPRERRLLAVPEMRSLFRKSSSANLLTLQGRALALCLGQTCEAGEAMRAVDQALVSEVSLGRLLAAQIRGHRALLHPECHRQEQEILALVRGRLGMGRVLCVPGFRAEGEEKFQKALAVRNQIRIVSTAGALPEDLKIAHAVRPEKGTLPPLLVCEKTWDAGRIRGLLPDRTAGDLVIGVQGPARNGDFLSVAQAVSLFPGYDDPDPDQRTYTLCNGVGYTRTRTTVEIRSGDLPRDPKVPWLELENRPFAKGAICVVSAGYPEALRRAVNFEMARRLVLSRPFEDASDWVSLDFVVPRPEAAVGMEVVVFKSHLQFYPGTRWKIREVLPDGGLRLGKARSEITMSSARFEELADFLAIVEVHRLRLVPGMRLQAERSFSQRKLARVSVKETEIVTVVGLGEDGSLVLADGREIPSRFRAFSPAFLVRKLPPNGKRREVVLAVAPGEVVSKREWARSFRSDKLIVFTGQPEKFAEELGCDAGLYRAQQCLRTTLLFVSGEGEFVPSASDWDELLALQKLPVIVKIPEQIRPLAIADDGEADSPAVTWTPGSRAKKKKEDEIKPPQKKRREEQESPASGGGAPSSRKRSPKAAELTREDDAPK